MRTSRKGSGAFLNYGVATEEPLARMGEIGENRAATKRSSHESSRYFLGKFPGSNHTEQLEVLIDFREISPEPNVSFISHPILTLAAPVDPFKSINESD